MIQAAAYRILNCFLENDTLSFSVLCKHAGYPTDLGGYYIRQLLEGGYLAKGDRGQYKITPKGKQQVATARGTHLFAQRPRLTVLLLVKQGDVHIVLRRGRQPFIDTTEWPAGAVNLGEDMAHATSRILSQRLGIAGNPMFVGFFRRTDFYQDETNVFDDKLFAVHTVQIEPNAPISTPEPDQLIHCKTEDLAKLERPAKSLADIYDFVRRGAPYEEHRYILSAEDLNL